MGIYTANLDLETGQLVRFGGYTPIGVHTEVTVGAVTAVLTRPEVRVTGILIQAVNEPILFTLDGTDPSVEPGFLLPKDLLPIYIPILTANTLSVVRAGTSDSSVRYQWVREES